MTTVISISKKIGRHKFENYRGITLLAALYASILYYRLKALADN